MKILVVNSNSEDRAIIVSYLQNTCPKAQIITTEDGMQAVQLSMNIPIDAVYTEAQMPRISGFDVARLVRKFRPDAKIYLVCETSEYLNIAINQGLQGYYLKPLTEDTFQTGNLLRQEKSIYPTSN